MLGKETIEAIAKTLSLNAEELAKAISDETERELSIPKLITYTDEEWEKYEKRLQKERDDERALKFNEGREMGIKAEINRLSEVHGINLQDRKKTIQNFVDEYQKKAFQEAKIEPEKKVQELESDLQKVREQVKIFEENEKKIKSEYEGNLKNFKIENKLAGLIPSELKGIDPNDARLIIKNNFEFDFVEDVFVVKKGGEVLKSKTREPIDPKEAVEDFLKERKYLDVEGRGGDDSAKFGSNGRITNMTGFNEYCEKNKINPNGEDARIKLNEITKQNKDFDFNS